MEADFSGWATKANLVCSDGRTITPQAFKHMDGVEVPLVWAHGHNEPANILGKAKLEHRDEGVYAHAFFNSTEAGQIAKALVQHGDIKALSIYANRLKEQGKNVMHGMIREVSLVLSGANPGALIENVRIAHSDDYVETLEDEIIVFTGELIEHDGMGDENDEDVEHAEAGATVQDIYDSFDEDQKRVVHFMIGAALEAAQSDAKHSDSDDEDEGGDAEHNNTDEGDLNHQEGTQMKNVFEKNGSEGASEGYALSHDDVQSIVKAAHNRGDGSLRHAMEEFALAHGVDDIEMLFPDATLLNAPPAWEKRRTEWVAKVLNGTQHRPYSRIKTRTADLNYEGARAKGYIKGSVKKEEWFGLAQRVTTPATVYKKQSLDRDDIIDITEFDIVAWLWGEMRLMIEEETARAILLGDGREVTDPDKVKDPAGAAEGAGIRSIRLDHDAYAVKVAVDTSDYNVFVKDVIRAGGQLKASGTPTFFTTKAHLTEMLLLENDIGDLKYRNKAEVASRLGVDEIVEVEVMEEYPDVVGIIVNLNNYAVGTDKGGELTKFDDFDIKVNKYEYLIETRLSGALTELKAALVLVVPGAGDSLATPVKPAFDSNTNTVTIPTTTGVDYTIDGVVQAAGDVVITKDTKVVPVAQDTYYLSNTGGAYRYSLNRDV